MVTLTSSEIMEKRKSTLIPNYSSTVSGKEPKGSKDGYSTITELRKMTEETKAPQRITIKVQEPITLQNEFNKNQPMLVGYVAQRKDYICFDGTHLYL